MKLLPQNIYFESKKYKINQSVQDTDYLFIKQISLVHMKDLSQSFISKARYRSKLLVILIACNIALSSFYFGYLNNCFGALNIHTMIEIFDIPLSAGTAAGVINGIIPLSSVVGAAITYHYVNNVSRRKMILITNSFALFAGMVIFIQNFYTLLLGRFIQGACVGCYITMSPLIIRQIAPTEIAGVIGSIPQMFMSGGVAFACIFQYLLATHFQDKETRIIWVFVLGFPLITVTIQTLVLLYVFPYQTPKYLISIGDRSAARRLIQKLYKQNYYEQVQMQKIEDFKLKEKHDKQFSQLDNQLYGGHSILLKIKSNAGIIALFIAIMQQLSGINPISIYGYEVAKNSVQSIRQLVPSIINGLQFIGTVKASYLLHRFGRKQLFVYGGIGMSIALFTLYVGLLVQQRWNGLGTFFILCGLCGFSLVFGMTIAPCNWLYISQIVDPQVVPYLGGVNRFSAFVSVLMFPIITTNILEGDCSPWFLFFSLLMLFFSFFCRKYLIETKGKEEKQIRLQFREMKW